MVLVKKSNGIKKNIKLFELNFGPQHPAAHGVLRLLLSLNGEEVYGATPHIGLLHRGTEKLAEEKSTWEILPYLDRLDYVSMMNNEHVFSLAVEKCLGLVPCPRSQYVRVIFLEITRILNHIMAITTHAMDVGALTPFLWGFEEREKLMEFYERVSGARMHSAYIRPGGILFDLANKTLWDIYEFAEKFNSRIDEIEELLTSNRIWKKRLVGVGVVNREVVNTFGLTGVLARGSGLKVDYRVNKPYDAYKFLKFQVPTGVNGDCYDRYKVRIEEMRQSVNIILQAIDQIPAGNLTSNNFVFSRAKSLFKSSMNLTIAHFKSLIKNDLVLTDSSFTFVEAPKGEMAIFILLSNESDVNRLKITAPGFFHLQATHFMSHKHLIADVVTIIGTQDIVFGEVDR